jgi:hypothetical protein
MGKARLAGPLVPSPDAVVDDDGHDGMRRVRKEEDPKPVGQLFEPQGF